LNRTGRIYQFPRGFLWGAATSSHQVDGNNTWNDWWESEQRGQLPHQSGDACREYELFQQDFDMARSWGHNAHRFSIEWSRLEPGPGRWSHEAAAHYRDVIRALKERELEPIVTLHHFTNPAWFTRRGGWLRGDSCEFFARHVERVAEEIGDGVRYWLTVNEPTVYVLQGFITGEWPPFARWRAADAALAFKNLARAHVVAYERLHRQRDDIMVGFSHSAPVIQPFNPSHRRDRLAASIRDFVLNRAFFRLIGMDPRRSRGALDFIGVNYYTRNVVRSGWSAIGAVVGRVCTDHPERGAVSTLGWEVYPAGLQLTLERFSEYGLPLFVTENGIATTDETLRRKFVVGHLAALAGALETGVNVLGYLYWSLIDNFEWSFGTGPKFGLAAVNFSTQARSPRPAAVEFSRVCRENRLVESA
jgi:beta-glucosidase